MNLNRRTGMLNSTASFSPWSVSNVKSNRTDVVDSSDNIVTLIGNSLGPNGVGHTYQVDSEAIESARFDPTDNSLNVTYRNGNGTEYKFAADGNDAAEWLQAPSKGRLTQEWRKTHRYPGY